MIRIIVIKNRGPQIEKAKMNLATCSLAQIKSILLLYLSNAFPNASTHLAIVSSDLEIQRILFTVKKKKKIVFRQAIIQKVFQRILRTP